MAVVIDSKIIAESPYRFTASGCGDIISKATEVRDWRLAHEENGDYYGGYAASLSLMSSEHVMNSADLISKRTQEGIRTLLEALVSCGVAMSIAGSSRPTSGSAHLFSHALDMIAEKPALHGEQCGVGVIMMAKLHGLDWDVYQDSLSTIGAPTTAKELDIEQETIVKALTIAHTIRPERYTLLNKIKLDHESARALAESTGVI
jgi:glycerol-1-phosphate dehydrogenase [NAD(P)+]